jgi:hypothetical protein
VSRPTIKMSHFTLVSRLTKDYRYLSGYRYQSLATVPVLSLVFLNALIIINSLEKTTKLCDSLLSYQALPHQTSPLLCMGSLHSWDSAFRHPAAQSGIGAFRYWTGPLYCGTGLTNFHSVIELNGCRTVRQSGIKIR